MPLTIVAVVPERVITTGVGDGLATGHFEIVRVSVTSSSRLEELAAVAKMA